MKQCNSNIVSMKQTIKTNIPHCHLRLNERASSGSRESVSNDIFERVNG